MTALSTLFPASSGGAGPGMQFGARTAYTSSGTKTVATETNWVPPSGMALWGFRVIGIGAGGGAYNASGGGGGNRVERIISLEEMGSPSTVAITVGAGSNNAAGGNSSFGSWLIAHGGQVGGVSIHPDEDLNFNFPEGMPGEAFATSSGVHGAHSSKGRRGGGGCAYDGAYGGVSFPRQSNGVRQSTSGTPTAPTTTSPPWRSSSTSPTPADGVGDWPGDGGPNNTDGKFPGGGAGADAAQTTQRRGGHGVVIVYAIFKKA